MLGSVGVGDGTGQTVDNFWGDVCGGRGRDDGAVENARPAGAVAGRFFVARKEHDGVFSAGDFAGGESGAFDFVVCG